MLAGRPVGAGHRCFVVAEIGINHNGDVDIARGLIDAAANAGADAVKFQKRTVEVVYSDEELARPRESPFGDTNGDLKRGLELGRDDYEAIDVHCRTIGVPWVASCWDEGSVDFVEAFEPPFYKIASASLTDDGLLRRHRATGRPMVLSTGMSTIDEIDHAVEVVGTSDLVMLHTTSTYPSELDELNLAAIGTLSERYPVPVGYSGHEVGLAPSVAAAALGACLVERHITLDRAMWGTDQAASVEPGGFARMVRDIRAVERAMGDGIKRVYDSEQPIRAKLRRVG
jgi:N-acetylneuraminate synthase